VRLLITIVSTMILSLILIVERPDLMIQPGMLSEGHRELDRDCLRCHTLMQEAATASCLRCHDLATIGLRTTKGVSLAAGRRGKILFHASLADRDCTACHQIHAGTRHRQETTFQHDYLAPSVRVACQSCHLGDKPANALHQGLKVGCAACHNPSGWRPASFDHAKVIAVTACVTCHQKDKPGDTLHRQAGDGCAACHRTAQWSPASFEHARYFRFDANHPPDCQTCHVERATYATYTCYGCHVHSPSRIAAEHREEGIRSFDNCVRCHRSGSEEGEGGEQGGYGERGRRGGEHEGGEDGEDDG
jgi:hypothetical protein